MGVGMGMEMAGSQVVRTRGTLCRTDHLKDKTRGGDYCRGEKRGEIGSSLVGEGS